MTQLEELFQEFNPYLHDPLLTPIQVAAYCGVKRQTVDKWRRQGLLKCTYVCADVRFRLSEVNRFIQLRTESGLMKGK